MSRIIFDTWVEIPIKVTAYLAPAEGDNWNSPYIPQRVEIEDVSFDEKEVYDYIHKEHTESLIDEACGIIRD